MSFPQGQSGVAFFMPASETNLNYILNEFLKVGPGNNTKDFWGLIRLPLVIALKNVSMVSYF